VPLDPPIHVDWLAASEVDGGPGRLGLTFLPGKRGPSVRYPGLVYRRDLGADLETLRGLGVRHLLLLVDDGELSRWGDAAIVERGAASGVTIERRPVSDGHAPASVAEMDSMLASLAVARRSGDAAIACMGGVGRAGTVAACALVAAGLPASSAVARVREVRHPTAVETAEQVAFVGAYERHVAAARSGSDKVAP